MPRVELISNIFHYYHTALSLHRCGYLGDYITGPSALDNEASIQRWGRIFERLWIERRLEGIPPQLVKRMWLPEIVQKAVKRLGGTGEQSNWVHNELFAREAARLMTDCDVVHFVNSVGREAARKAKRSGAVVICDMREEHPDYQEQILSEEAERLKIQFTVPGSSYRHRIIEELHLADYIFCPSCICKTYFCDPRHQRGQARRMSLRGRHKTIYRSRKVTAVRTIQCSLSRQYLHEKGRPLSSRGFPERGTQKRPFALGWPDRSVVPSRS